MKDEVLEATYLTTETDYETERNKPMPNIIHGAIQTAIATYLSTTYDNEYIFPGELSLDTTPGSTPDICIYPKKKLNIKTVTAKESDPPLTTIEILSPSQSVNDLMRKAWDLYFPLGVKSAWIVVPEFKAIHILLPNDDSILVNTGMLVDPTTGIQIPVEKVFKDLL